MNKKEVLLKEYEEANKICMHYENLRRQGANIFIIIQGGLGSIFFLEKMENPVFLFLLSFLGIITSLMTFNNEIRVYGYYMSYVVRLKDIEEDLEMKLFSNVDFKSKYFRFSFGNKYYYRIVPLLVCCFWLVSLFYDFK
ncbi:hypothetical protein [Marinifilum caeruleilacunae]|uniref:Uncharacterized protein n=1 Tax=Marinifilum caeruleilacunae TaxID=2499076 RepID=A0ABX1WWV7_9BACT|nr:hypothetical protein [Marinifilum caeruleilacunae]NOU60597.1 hypothetical protein [Marinifilum caeruleilacunae]